MPALSVLSSLDQFRGLKWVKNGSEMGSKNISF